NLATRSDFKNLHDRFSVEVRTHRVEFLLLLEFGNSALDVVIGEGEAVGFALIASGHVGSSENVEAFEFISRIANVAAHCGVGPLLVAVPEEPEVEFDETRNGCDG